MSDSLTDEQKVIDRVLEDCYPVFDPDGHINGTVPGRGAWDCWCGMVVNTTEAEVRKHVTVEIDKALGGLTREWGVVVAYPPRPDDGYPGAVVMLDSYRLREAAEEVRRTKYAEDGYELRTRFVGGWTPGETS